MEYQFTLTGSTPFLAHADDVMAADALSAWRRDPINQSLSVPGDDRSPPWTWMQYLYSDGVHLALPQENVLAALRTAGAKIPSKGKTTFKSMSQSGLIISQDFCEFRCNGEQIAMADIVAKRDLPFAKQMDAARAMGFDLLVKRASVGSSKHVRVRAKFTSWSVCGEVTVIEPAITEEVLGKLFEIAGRLSGIGDWRPSSPKKPGPYGMFSAKIVPIKPGRKA